MAVASTSGTRPRTAISPSLLPASNVRTLKAGSWSIALPIRSCKQAAHGFPQAQGHLAPTLTLWPTMKHVAPLAKGFEVLRRGVGRIVVEVSGRQHDTGAAKGDAVGHGASSATRRTSSARTPALSEPAAAAAPKVGRSNHGRAPGKGTHLAPVWSSGQGDPVSVERLESGPSPAGGDVDSPSQPVSDGERPVGQAIANTLRRYRRDGIPVRHDMLSDTRHPLAIGAGVEVEAVCHARNSLVRVGPARRGMSSSEVAIKISHATCWNDHKF